MTVATMMAQPVSMPSLQVVSSNLQSERTITILLTSFAGLGLPRTLSLPLNARTTIHDALENVDSRLPKIDHALIITTTSNKQLLLSNNQSISTLLSNQHDTFLPLRLSARLCGGKGGFGSQLRAAGGRMSSRKNRNQQNQNPNGSNRNLDGRRLRTVDTAKRLAEYLATQPTREEKEKKERMERLAKTMEDVDSKAELIKSGKMGASQGRLDADYVESKEQAEEKTRQAVLKVTREDMLNIERTGSESSMDVDKDGSEDENDRHSSESSQDIKIDKPQSASLNCFGWSDEEELSDEDEEEGAADLEDSPGYPGKGKERAE